MLGTLRADGSPRLSGIEVTFRDGDLWLGMMPDSLKALDLRRDPRVALHSATVDPELVEGDARISGLAVEATGAGAMMALVEGDTRHEDGAPAGHVFRVDVRELMLIKIGEPGRPPRDRVLARGAGSGAYRAPVAGGGAAGGVRVSAC